MIPSQISIAPLMIAMLVVVAGCAYAAYKAGVGIATFPRQTRAWNAAVGLTAVAVILGASMAGFMIFANANHDRTYSDAVWSTLAKEYHVYPAVADTAFKPNVPFAGMLNGAAVDCTVSLPNVVVCGGEKLNAINP